MHHKPYAAARPQSATTSSTRTHGIYNVGQTLYKAALIILCIVAFESLIVYFMKDFLKISIFL